MCSDHVLQPKHKIFLSHSGSQKSFVADLYADLKRRDRHSFFDIVESCLPIGEKFPNLIFDAIKQCQVGVVVLSEEIFTKTKWPMLELMAMFEESKKPDRRINIIPIFYTISREMCCNPSVQAKWMTNDWKKWEEEDKARIDLVKWKGALSIFGSRTGIVMKDGMLDRDLRAKIVEAICKEVLSEASWDDSHVAGKTRLCRVSGCTNLSHQLVYTSMKLIHVHES
jgi:hypothetical protein